ncbi:MAG TPA: hypothetical protein VFW19_04415 [Allosphingosinicella sp.]|nr:hypothetical protein [Allosphingosinicella sp.]
MRRPSWSKSAADQGDAELQRLVPLIDAVQQYRKEEVQLLETVRDAGQLLGIALAEDEHMRGLGDPPVAHFRRLHALDALAGDDDALLPRMRHDGELRGCRRGEEGRGRRNQ